MTNSTTIGFNNQESRKIAEMLVQKIDDATGFAIKAQQTNNASIQFNIKHSSYDPAG